MQYLFIARLYPSVSKFLDILIPQSMKQKRKDHFNWSAERAQSRVHMKTDRQDFFSYMLREKGEKGMSDDELSEAAGILIMAGSETVSNT